MRAQTDLNDVTGICQLRAFIPAVPKVGIAMPETRHSLLGFSARANDRQCDIAAIFWGPLNVG